MSTFDTPVEIGDKSELSDALNSLIRVAETNGVDLEGGYDCADGEGGTYYGVEIYRVAGRSD